MRAHLLCLAAGRPPKNMFSTPSRPLLALACLVLLLGLAHAAPKEEVNDYWLQGRASW